MLEFRLRHEPLGIVRRIASDMGSFHQHRVDARRRIREQRLEQPRLSAMRTNVARVEDPPPVALDQHRVGIERGVIVEERRDRERSDRERSTIAEEARRRDLRPSRGEEASGINDGGGLTADEHWNIGIDATEQPVVIEVWVRDQQAVKRRVGRDEARDRRHRHIVRPTG